jgi:hypothetical protein
MRLKLRKTGGIAGLKVSAEVDSEKLPEAQAKKMKELVDQADLFNQASAPRGKSSPDQFQYEISVEEGGKTHTFSTNESTASDDLLDLIDWMTEAARAQKSGNG